MAWSKYFAEFIGTYFLVFTAGCNVLSGSIGAAFSIGAMLMVMVYSLGSVSGAHFNPAVTLAVWMSSRGLLPLRHALRYVLAQLLGALCGALSYWLICGGSFIFEPIGRHDVYAVGQVEVLYTAALCYVFLNVLTAHKQDGNQYFGLAIGFTVVAAGLSVAGISGCSLNPALSLAAALASTQVAGFSALTYVPAYCFSHFLGSVLGFAAFYVVRKADEYAPEKQADLEDLGSGTPHP